MILTETGRPISRLVMAGALCCILGPSNLLAQDRGSQTNVWPTALSPENAVALELSDAVLSSALFRAIVDSRPENLDAVAIRYQQIGILDKAMDYYAESLSRNPSGVAALDGTARIWRDWGEMGPALGSAYRAVYASPLSPEAWNTLGTILQDVGDLSAASDAYMRARRVDASASYVASNLCYLAFIQGQVERAFGECTLALALDRSLASTWNNLGLLYAATGDRLKAAETFMAAGSHAAAHYNLGIVLMADRDYPAAARAFELASRTRPGFYAALNMAAFARKRARAEAESTNAGR